MLSAWLAADEVPSSGVETDASAEERDSSAGVEAAIEESAAGVWQLAKREAKASTKIFLFIFIVVFSLPLLSHFLRKVAREGKRKTSKFRLLVLHCFF